MVEIPQREILQSARQILYISIAILIITFLLIVFMIYTITEQAKRESVNMESLNTLEKSQQNLQIATAAIRENERLLDAIFNKTKTFVGLLDPLGRMIKANKALLDFIGLNEADVIGRFFWECPWWIHSFEESERLKNAIFRVASGDFYKMETIHQSHDGTIHTIDFIINPIRNAEGDVIYILPEGNDITEIRKAEHAIIYNEERYRFLSSSTFEGVIITKDRDIIDINDQLLNIFGFSLEVIKSKGLKQIIHPDDHKLFMHKTLSRFIEPFEIRGIHVNGTEMCIEIRAKYIEKNSETLRIWVVRDITERKIIELELQKYRHNLEILVLERTHEIEALNEELLQTNEELGMTNEYLVSQQDELKNTIIKLKDTQNQLIQSEKMAALGVLTAGIAHEINNPINFISTSTQGLHSIVADILSIDDEF